MTTDTVAGDSASFASFSLRPALLKALLEVGYEQPSPIQAAAIPVLLQHRDVLGLAQTGTGKTAAFALPILHHLKDGQRQPQALILAPTRELAIQVAEAFKRYARHLPQFTVAAIYGGQDMRSQLRLLQRGVHVVVGTPGRIMDHLRRGSLDLSALQTVVLDEGDEMLRMGFIDDVQWILEHAPEERHTALFSATMPGPIRRIAERHLREPQQIRIAAKTRTAEQIEQFYCLIPANGSKLDALTRLLEVSDFDAMIVFVRTKNATSELAERLEARGYRAAAINGDMNQAQRERTINALKKEQLDILVATDVAARGIDVTRVTHVINFDIPYDSEAYVHRIGRTGRAGRSGEAILFITKREQHLLRAIERTTRQPIQALQTPSNKTIAQRRLRQFIAQIGSSMEAVDNLEFYRGVIKQICQQHQLSPEDAGALLVYQQQLERPLQAPSEPPRQARADRHANKRGADKRERPRDGDTPTNKRPRDKAPTRRKHPDDDVEMIRYRVEVGSEHQLRPGDLVGAIANEAGLDPDYIGAINIEDQHSYIEMPAGMPKALFRQLSKTWVRNRRLQLSIADDQPAHAQAGPSAKAEAKSGTKPAPRRPAKRKHRTGGDEPLRKKRARRNDER